MSQTFYLSRRLLITWIAILFIILIVPHVVAHQPPNAVYVRDKLYPGLNENIQFDIDELKASGFNTIIGWPINVLENGDILFSGVTIVSEGKYTGHPDWPSYVAQLKEGDTSIKELYFSIGEWRSWDFRNIDNLILAQGTESQSILYQNFDVLRATLPDIDGIDLDDEDQYSEIAIVEFSLMLGRIGYQEVSFCTYVFPEFWLSCLKQIEEKQPGLISQFNLMCYAGGRGNDPAAWQQAIYAAGFSVPVIPGLWCAEDTIEEMTLQFQAWQLDGIYGGFIFLYEDIHALGESPTSYSRAVRGGLEWNKDYIGLS